MAHYLCRRDVSISVSSCVLIFGILFYYKLIFSFIIIGLFVQTSSLSHEERTMYGLWP